MNLTRLLTTAIFVCIVSALWAQGTNATQKKSGAKQDSLRNGLKLMYSSRDRDWEDDVDIDMEELSATIQASIDKAMKSLDVALRNIDARHMNADIDIPEIEIPEIHIPDIDVDIPEINIHIPDIDMDIDHHHFDRDNDEEFHNADHAKDKSKEKFTEKGKEEKRKGLVKIK